MINYVFVEFLAGNRVVQISNEQEYTYFSVFLEFIGILGLQGKSYETWCEKAKDSILYFEYGDSIHLSCCERKAIQVLELLAIRQLDVKNSHLFPSLEQYRQMIQQRAAQIINA
ncbi:MAG: hypothetical protein Q4C49_07875 [Bacillota bacterium]|nr:hypothetical protein [Bacillota bacterium]